MACLRTGDGVKGKIMRCCGRVVLFASAHFPANGIRTWRARGVLSYARQLSAGASSPRHSSGACAPHCVPVCVAACAASRHRCVSGISDRHAAARFPAWFGSVLRGTGAYRRLPHATLAYLEKAQPGWLMSTAANVSENAIQCLSMAQPAS